MKILDTIVGGFWVAEYSEQQDAFNTTTLKQALEINCRMVVGKQNNGYLIFGIFQTLQEANVACEEMRKTQEAKIAQPA